MLYAFFFGSGIAILPGIAYFIRSWRNLELTIGIMSAALMSYYWWVEGRGGEGVGGGE